MHKNVETLIGRLATDPQLRRRFAEDPEAVLAELREGGLELTEIETDALAATDPEAFTHLAEALDRRLRKAVPVSGLRREAGAAHPGTTEPEPEDNAVQPDRNTEPERKPTMTRTTDDVRRTLLALVTAALAAVLGAGSAAADPSAWTWSVTPYAWATDVGVDVSLGDRQVVDETIPITDLIEDLDTIAQVRFEGRRGAHGILVDLFDVTLSSDGEHVALPGGAGEGLLDTQSGMTILDLAATYDPAGDGQGFSLLYGARLLDQRAEIDARFDLANGSTVQRDYETDEWLADALFGVRYTRRFSPRWSFQSQVDVSTGGTDLTWSAGSSVTYQLREDGRYALTVGYRVMEVDFEDDNDLDATMDLSGFLAGLRITF